MVPQSEVIRAIVSGYSPCYGVPLLPHRHAALSVPTGPAAHEVDQHLVRVGGPLADEEGERAAVRTGGPACWAHAAAHARRWAQETKARWGWQLDARSSGGAGACLCAVHTRQARTCARHGGGGGGTGGADRRTGRRAPACRTAPAPCQPAGPPRAAQAASLAARAAYCPAPLRDLSDAASPERSRVHSDTPSLGPSRRRRRRGCAGADGGRPRSRRPQPCSAYVLASWPRRQLTSRLAPCLHHTISIQPYI